MRSQKIFEKSYVEFTGVIHNHTNVSYDCDVHLKDIMEEAAKSKLDYITLNDHNMIFPKEELDKIRALHKNPLVINGCEINDLNDDHHLLVFNPDYVMNNHEVEEYLDYYEANDIFTIAAHPYEERRDKRYALYVWKKRHLLERAKAIEVWNFSSSWLSKLMPRVNGIFMVIFPNLFVRCPFEESLKLWDELNLKQKKAAVGSIDAHGTLYSILGFKFRILSHKYLFKTIRTNILINSNKIPEGGLNENLIFEALENGNSYIVNYKLGYPFNFFCGISDLKTKQATCGETIDFSEDLKLYFNLPSDATVRLINSGKHERTIREKKGFFKISKPGFYRLEVSKAGYGWIYTNNIYVV